jgi:hypothetical protein
VNPVSFVIDVPFHFGVALLGLMAKMHTRFQQFFQTDTDQVFSSLCIFRTPSGANRRLLMLESSTGNSWTLKPGTNIETLVWAELAGAKSTQAASIKSRKN